MEDTSNNDEEYSNHHSFYVDNGDLSIWEYLTNTFDYEVTFQQLPALDQSEWRNLHDLQHKVSASSLQEPQPVHDQRMQRKWQSNDVEQQNIIDNSHRCIEENYFSGIQFLPRPSNEPFSTAYHDQKIKAVSETKSPPLLRPSILVRNSPNWHLSIETFAQAKASSSPPITTPDFVQRNGRVLSHLKFPSFSHLTPPHQEKMDRKLLLKPLSPYNYYYRDERDNIVKNMQHPEDPLPPPISDQTQEKLERLLFQRWYVDPIKTKRRHRRSHGCISFEELARQIADRWHQQPDHVYNFYYTVSSMDKTYYRKQAKSIQGNEKGATSEL
jgi:hypothetical protein